MTDRSEVSPWGHKVVMVVYFEGEQAKAEMAAECIAGQVMVPAADFIGLSVEVVPDKPRPITIPPDHAER